MAAIFPRENKDGSTSWRVQIRRKGLKRFFATFVSKKEAENFVEQCEESYCTDPDNFTYDHLLEKRKREFNRKV